MVSLRNIFSGCVLIAGILQIGIAHAGNPVDTSCFTESASINVSSAQDIKWVSVWESTDIFFVQDESLVPYKILGVEKPKYIDYMVTAHSSGEASTLKNLNDANSSTVFSFDNLGDDAKSVTLDFGKSLVAGSFDTKFDFQHRGNVRFSIWENSDKLKNISESSIRDFGFRYLKIDFEKYPGETVSNKTAIAEINFFVSGPVTYVVKPAKVGQVEAYRGYSCESDKIRDAMNLYNQLNRKAKFAIDSSTGEFSVKFEPNLAYRGDFDTDGIPNTIDNCKFFSNPDQLDSDSDGLGDGCDLDKLNKNPLDGDTDNDGITDSRDNCRYLFNPDQKDSNADGNGDLCSDDDSDGIVGKNDNCPQISNPDQKDVNANGVGDACEFDKDADEIFDSIDNCMTKQNSDQADADFDGIGDACDNCKLSNPDQKDVNANGVGDACENAEKFAQENDSDKDGIFDFSDNCPKTVNPDQADSDQDGIGDTCDNCAKIQNPDQTDTDKNSVGDRCEDTDQDGIDGYLDNCPTVANPDQADRDNNNIGNVCEDPDRDRFINSKDNCPEMYNPDQSDVDHDEKWDVCDSKDDRYIESNKGFFAGIMVLIVAIFGAGIFVMVKKLKGAGK